MRIILFISVFFWSWLYGQDTTRIVVDSLPIQELTSVHIMRPMPMIRMETPRYTTLGKTEIEEMQANDVGEILQKIPGVNLKSYGGLGGLKTISVRSLGSRHSAVSVDGFSVQNGQTGQVNLAQVQTNNLESIALGIGEQSGYLMPVSAQIAGNNTSLQTFEMTFPGYKDSLQIRANTRIGSFGQVSGYAAAKVKLKKGFISGFGNYRTANGLYSYQIQNGLKEETAIRTNNDYQDHYVGGAFGYEIKNNFVVRLNYKHSNIDQGLPGAVILYNNSADERLSTGDHAASADARFSFGNGGTARVYVNGNSNTMRYVDPTYFNSTGEVDVTYLNRNLNAGIVGQGHFIVKSKHVYKRAYYFGVEGGMSDLHSSDSLFAQPIRKKVSAIVGTRLNLSKIWFIGHVSGQFVNEDNSSGQGGKNVIGINPYASLETKESSRRYARHRVWYRNSLRIPSFNELYYNNIGNTELNPEKANQFGYNLSFYPVDRNAKRIWITTSAYFNRVTDKIVAIPTQNLFTWSIQNVGIVHAFGGEIGSNMRFALGSKKKLILSTSVNYSFQRSLDMTDQNHPTFKHQIAYIPMHTGNFDLSVKYKQIGGKVSNYLVSKRYSLNENIVLNEVDGFAITDFSLFYNLELGSKHTIRIQGKVKNAFNRSYSYIRSFIMPGRNYLISINYAFN